MVYGLADKLKRLTIQQKLSQYDVASRIHVAPATISAYETGERTPSLENLTALANLYHISTDYLLGIDQPRYIPVLNTAHLNKNSFLLCRL